MSAATLATVYWLVKIAGAVLGACAALLVSALKLVDRKRQRHCPTRHVFGAGLDAVEGAPERAAPAMAGRPKEKVCRLSDVAGMMQTGDVLTFSGRSFWSYLIRIATFSDKSHAGMVVVDDEGLWVVDSCEGIGVTKRSLCDEVKKHPGQWYWSAIDRNHQAKYRGKLAAEAAMHQVHAKVQYGWGTIVLLAACHLPILREVAYLTGVSKLKRFSDEPDCSQAVTTWMRAGFLDPVRGRDPQLVTPQDINQSLAFREWVALVPG